MTSLATKRCLPNSPQMGSHVRIPVRVRICRVMCDDTRRYLEVQFIVALF
jgi:hypothetical protein